MSQEQSERSEELQVSAAEPREPSGSSAAGSERREEPQAPAAGPITTAVRSDSPDDLFRMSPQTVLNFLLVFVPFPIIGHLVGWSDAVVFVTACIGIIPLAGLMGKSTEMLSERVGVGLGGLLNATFGNACELIIAFAALRAGFYDIVKASITGSIVGNILLVLGGSMLAGGMRYETQYFNRTAACASATSLALAAISLTVPAVFDAWARSANLQAVNNEDELALSISIILFVVYLLGLLFSLKTHKHHYTGASGQE
ncbi:MAG: hypothetical protein ACRD3W_31235, partial [Terriglobales bacterium]